VVIRERPEGLITQRHLGAELPRRVRVKGDGRREGHGLVDAAESVDRDFLDEQLFRLHGLLSVDVLYLRGLCAHGPSFNSVHSAVSRHLRTTLNGRMSSVTGPTVSIPAPVSEPFPVGTPVVWAPSTHFVTDELLGGGTPWRLLRVNAASRRAIEKWREGGLVAKGEGALARRLVRQGFLHLRPTSSFTADDVGVVIVTRGAHENLTTLLQQFRDFDLVVVDDGSPNEDVAHLARRAGARFIRHETNRGPAAARNTGAAAQSQPYLLFIDADVQVNDARHLARHLRAAFEDPLVAAVAPRVQGSPGVSPRESFEHQHSPLDLGNESGLVVPLTIRSYVPTATLMVRASAWGSGFDEGLRTGEDVDFVWRLHDAGWLVQYDATQVVHHPARTTTREWWAQRYGYGLSAAALAERHGSRLAPVRLDAWTLVVWTSLLSGRRRLALGALGAARSHFTAQLPADVANRRHVANVVVNRGVATGALPLARSIVRTFGPVVLMGVVFRRTRRVAILLFVVGTAARWRTRGLPRPLDIPYAVADDAAYAAGVWRGALRHRSATALTPHVTMPTFARTRRRPTMTKPRPPEGERGSTRT